MRRDEVAGSRGVRHTLEKKRKETTCAEGRGGRIERSLAHVKEEKEGNDVRGRTRWPNREGTGTRQRRKGKKRRVRRDEVAGSRGDWHTSEKKRKETTCAEGRGGWIERGLAHVREEKEENDVCGRTRWPDREGTGTRQRRKGKKRRVRRDEVADERGGSYLPRKKKARSSQEKQEKGRNI